MLKTGIFYICDLLRKFNNQLAFLRGNGNGEGGDINLKGSSISAGNHIDLDAKRDVNILAAANTLQSDSQESSYSVSIGIQAQAGGDVECPHFFIPIR